MGQSGGVIEIARGGEGNALKTLSELCAFQGEYPDDRASGATACGLAIAGDD